MSSLNLENFQIIDAEPEVTVLEGPSINPILMAGAAAHICYYPPTPSTVIHPKEVPLKKARSTSAYTMSSGHLTTWTHSYYTFMIDNVSRLYINEVLHDHPFYNSNQISGRYRIFDKALVRMPPFQSSHNKTEVEKLYKMQFITYHSIVPLLERDLIEMGPRRPDDQAFKPEGKTSRIEKMAIEAARYVLPMWQLSGMFHDTNGLVALRYYALQNIVTTSWEHRIVAKKMREAINEFEEEKIRTAEQMKSFASELVQLANSEGNEKLLELINKHRRIIESLESSDYFEEKLFDFYDDIAISNAEILPLPKENSALHDLYTKILLGSKNRSKIVESYNESFDDHLRGHRSLLFSYLPYSESILADSVRMTNPVTVQMKDEEAIEYALNPAKNPILNHPFNLEIHDPISQAMNSIVYRFLKKCSWIADSQLIRHRTSRGQRSDPRIAYTEKPDVFVPELIERNKEARQIFDEIVKESWEVQNMLIDSEENPEFAIGVKPQAVLVRYGETSNLSDLRHRFKQRTCLRAQEEAWKISTDELIQVYEVHPLIGKFLGPPCIPRSFGNIKPQCDQGYLWCGLPVWTMWGDTKKIEEISYYPSVRKLVVEKYPSKIKT